MAEAQRAWSFLITGFARQHGGNLGYDDVVHSYYSFDSTVPNSRRVLSGDLAVVRNSNVVLGSAVIERLDAWTAEKTRRRCPACLSTDFKARITVDPPFRCGHCRKEFARPLEEVIEVTAFRAWYGRTWTTSLGIRVEALEAAYFGRAKQHAIRELRLAETRRILDRP